MTVGSPTVNSRDGAKPGLAYTCLETILTRGNETLEFPKRKCPVRFPTLNRIRKPAS